MLTSSSASSRLPATMAKTRRDDEAADLAWYLDFTQADLATYRDGDLLNAWETIEAHESETGLATLALDSQGHPDVGEARAWLAALQSRLRGLFTNVEAARSGERVSIPFAGRVMLTADKALHVDFIPKHRSPKERFAEGVVLGVVGLLARIELERLHKCPECRRWFLASRRSHQKFDRPECRMRDWFKRKEARRSRGRRSS